MRRRFVTLDVFTDRRFAGNPLAVVLDADGLETAAMQAVAREFNHPETVFVFAPYDPPHRARLRIFTPAANCRSPAIRPSGPRCCSGCSTAAAPRRESWWRSRSGRCDASRADRRRARRARFTVPQLPADGGRRARRRGDRRRARARRSRDRLRRIPPVALDGRNSVNIRAAARLGAIADYRPDADKLVAAFGDGPGYLFCGECVEAGHAFHARMFAPALECPRNPRPGRPRRRLPAPRRARLARRRRAMRSPSSRATRWAGRA